METRSPLWRTMRFTIAFVVTCVVTSIGAYHVFGGTLPLQPEGYRVVVDLPRVVHLVPGSEVQVAGVHVGKVVRVSRAANGATAEIQLERQYAPLRANATAIERSKTLLGEGYLELALGPPDAAPIAEGGRLPASQVRDSVQLDEFVSTFDRATRTQLRRMFAGLAGAVDERASDLNDTAGELAPLSADADDVLAELQRQRPELQRFISGSATVLDALGEREGRLESAVRAGRDVLSVTASRDRALAETVRVFPPFLRELRATADRVTDASQPLGRAASALLPVARRLPSAMQQIDAAAPTFRSVFHQLPGTLSEARRSLPKLKPILAATQTAFRAFHPTSREMIPILQMLAKERDLVLILGNVAGVLSGSYAGPKGIVTGYAPGVPTFWNETLAGWVRKLPTNRQNAYPKSADVVKTAAERGVLPSFDCRNTKNPPGIPATGRGTPPCILQGPWELNGTTAYFPRLQPSPP